MADKEGYELWGMNFKGYVLDHDAALPIHKVLKKISKWLKENAHDGSIETVYTGPHPDDESRLRTTVIWAEF